MTKTNLANSFNKGFHGDGPPAKDYSGTSDLAKKNPKSKSQWEKSEKPYAEKA